MPIETLISPPPTLDTRVRDWLRDPFGRAMAGVLGFAGLAAFAHAPYRGRLDLDLSGQSGHASLTLNPAGQLFSALTVLAVAVALFRVSDFARRPTTSPRDLGVTTIALATALCIAGIRMWMSLPTLSVVR